MKKALIILESSWREEGENFIGETVHPFFSSLKTLHNSLNIYYQTFHKREGFSDSLENTIPYIKEKRIFLYIATHGWSQKYLADGIYLSTILDRISQYKRKIEGLLLGSCNIGRNADMLSSFLTSSGISWLFGYKDEIDWLLGTVIDLCIMDKMLSLPQSATYNQILNQFVKALMPFNINLKVDSNLSLGAIFALFVKPKGSPSKNMTDTLLHKLKAKNFKQ